MAKNYTIFFFFNREEKLYCKRVEEEALVQAFIQENKFWENGESGN